jgi:hypothetical protein
LMTTAGDLAGAEAQATGAVHRVLRPREPRTTARCAATSSPSGAQELQHRRVGRRRPSHRTTTGSPPRVPSCRRRSPLE